MWPFLFWPFWYVAVLDFHCGRFGLICGRFRRSRFGFSRFGCNSTVGLRTPGVVGATLYNHRLGNSSDSNPLFPCMSVTGTTSCTAVYGPDTYST